MGVSTVLQCFVTDEENSSKHTIADHCPEELIKCIISVSDDLPQSGKDEIRARRRRHSIGEGRHDSDYEYDSDDGEAAQS